MTIKAVSDMASRVLALRKPMEKAVKLYDV